MMIGVLALSAVLLGFVYALRFMVGLFIDNPFVHSEFLPLQIPPYDGLHEVTDHDFTTADGVTLRGSLVKRPDRRPKGVVVFAPEFRGTRESWKKYTSFLVEEGYAVFAFDFRGTGESAMPEGFRSLRWCTDAEVLDLKAAVKTAREDLGLGFEQVTLFGVSRGSVAAMVVGATDSRIDSAVVEGCHSTVYVIEHYMKRWAEIWVPRFVLNALPSGANPFLARLVLRLGSWRCGSRLPQVHECGPMASGGPVLFIFGGRDRHVTPIIADKTYDAYPGDKDRWTVARARHNMAVLEAPDDYRKRILSHLNRGPAPHHSPEAARSPDPLLA